MWKVDPKDNHIHEKQASSYTNSYVVHGSNSETTLWNLGERGKGKENDKESLIS
jgi:hypothetical protein